MGGQFVGGRPPVIMTNLITNGSFEVNITGWTKQGVGTMSQGGIGYNGTKSLQLTGDASANEVYAEYTIPFVLNHIYYYSVMVKTDSLAGGTYAQLYLIDAQFLDVNDGGTILLTNNWQKKSMRTNMTPASGNMTVRVDFDNYTTTGNMFVDSVIVVDLTASFGAGNEPTQAWCDKNIPYFEGSSKKTLTNIITNGGFENGTTGWAVYQGYMASNTAQFLSGAKSIAVTLQATKNAMVLWRTANFTFVNGNKYYLASNVKTSRKLTYPSEGAQISTESEDWTEVYATNAGYDYDKWNAWQKLSLVTSAITHPTGGFNVNFTVLTTDTTLTGYWDSTIIVDLTASFGKGNEPTKEWCDANIPYFDTTLALNLVYDGTAITYAVKQKHAGVGGTNRQLKKEFRCLSGVNRQVLGATFEQIGSYGSQGSYTYTDSLITLKVGSPTSFIGSSGVKVNYPLVAGDLVAITFTAGQSGASYYIDPLLQINDLTPVITSTTAYTATKSQAFFIPMVSKSGGTNQIGTMTISKITVNGVQIFPVI